MSLSKWFVLIIICAIVALVCSCKKHTVSEIASDEVLVEEPLLGEFRKIEEDTTVITFVETDSTKDTKETALIVIDAPKKKKAKKKYGRIKFDSLIHHLPDMMEGEEVSQSFRFVNEGKGPIQILTAEASCGCTTPSIPFLNIPPGGEGRIGVEYNSVNKLGLQQPDIQITTNGIPRKVTLKMIVLVNPSSEAIKDTLSN